MSGTSKKISFKSKRTKVRVALFTGLDIWLENWEKLILNRDLRWLIVDEKYRNHPVDKIILRDACDDITDLYFKEIGLDIENDEMFVLMQKLIEARNKYCNGDKSAKNFVKIFTHQIADIKRKAVKPDLIKNRQAVSKWNGYAVNPKTTTLMEFLKLVEIMKDEAELMRSTKKYGEVNQG